ncbi:anti-repressor SinI family protein [Fredinandcohnia quinoae]|uniref:Anti-repressor SinI family protein n=1 Tax=Fredinandcohnia quinoae TaxID=2918902 RepID=A0AAW5DW64_9BACI|nr:anti-repressor SinI family protein [Fredinandcohnia sp. SECRCQ15]MCH1624871.1 anti-repressor SinI family protein [Fredinandcohnia sp. SECRCQ15]
MNQANTKLDDEWVDLILEALDMGLSVEDIKAFFIKNKDGYTFT